MSVDTKVQMDINCPFCKGQITICKKRETIEKSFACPACKKILHILFHVNECPQTYEFLKDDEVSEVDIEKKKKTVYKKSVNGASSYEKINKHHVHDDDIYDDEDDMISPPKRKRHFRGHVYLTHIKWFGLNNEKYPLSEGKTTIGRYDIESPSDISIMGDSTMSRQSVAIMIEDEDGEFTFKLKVLRAANAVKVNNVRIKEGHSTYLEFGDIIILGNTKFKFDNQ